MDLNFRRWALYVAIEFAKVTYCIRCNRVPARLDTAQDFLRIMHLIQPPLNSSALPSKIPICSKKDYLVPRPISLFIYPHEPFLPARKPRSVSSHLAAMAELVPREAAPVSDSVRRTNAAR